MSLDGLHMSTTTEVEALRSDIHAAEQVQTKINLRNQEVNKLMQTDE